VFQLALETGAVLAQETPEGTGGGNPLGFLLPVLLIGGVFYLVLILPQRRRMKKAEQMRSAITVGDDVRTVGGILGTIRSEEGDTFLIDVGGGTTLRVAKRAVAERLEDEDE